VGLGEKTVGLGEKTVGWAEKMLFPAFHDIRA